MEKGIIKLGKMKIACNKCSLNKSKDGPVVSVVEEVE